MKIIKNFKLTLFLLLVLVFNCVSLVNAQKKVLVITTPGLSTPANFFQPLDNEKLAEISTRKTDEISYDLLGNKWNSKERQLLTTKGKLQNAMTGSLIKSYYSSLIGLKSTFKQEEINLYIPYCSESNKVFSNTNCNRRYQETIAAHMRGFYPKIDFNLSDKIKITELPFKTIYSDKYSSSTFEKYFSCKEANEDYKFAILEEKLDENAEEFNRKFKELLKQSLKIQTPFTKEYFDSTSKFTNVVKLCEAFELAYLGENLSGLDIEKMNSEKQKELYIECKLIFKKNMFHSMLKTNHQTQFLVRNFIEDLVNNLDHELLSLEDYKNSITYQTLQNYKDSNGDDDRVDDTIQMNESTPKNKDDIPFYDRINFEGLKKYTLIVEEQLFQAAVMKFFYEVFGSKKYYPTYSGSLLFEITNEEKNKSIVVYYNNYIILEEKIVIFNEKIKAQLLTEKELAIYCGFDINMDKILNIILYIVFAIFITITIIILLVFFTNKSTGTNQKSNLNHSGSSIGKISNK